MRLCLAFLMSLFFIFFSCSANQKAFSEDEMRSKERVDLMRSDEKVFYLISDDEIGQFTKRAQVFTQENGKFTVYLTIKESIIRDKNGDVLIDGSKYGSPFFAWKIETPEHSDKGFYISCYWTKNKKPSTTDPLLIMYYKSDDVLKIWHPDPSVY